LSTELSDFGTTTTVLYGHGKTGRSFAFHCRVFVYVEWW